MLNCKEVTELCSQELERPLRLGERMNVRMHLIMCSGCTNFRDQVGTLRRVANAYSEGASVDAEVDDRGVGVGLRTRQDS